MTKHFLVATFEATQVQEWRALRRSATDSGEALALLQTMMDHVGESFAQALVIHMERTSDDIDRNQYFFQLIGPLFDSMGTRTAQMSTKLTARL